MLVGYLNAGAFPEKAGTLHALRNLIYSFHMPLYFMISGCVYSKAYCTSEGRPKRNKLFYQIGNLVAVYIIFSLFYGLGKVAFGRFANHTLSPKALLLIWVQPIDEFWYLYVLIEFYLLFYFLRPVRHNIWFTLSACLALSLCSQFGPGLFKIDSVLWYSFFFCMGIVYQRYERVSDNYMAVCGLFAVSAVLLIITWEKEQAAAVRLLIAFGISAALWYVFKHIGSIGNNGILRFCGRSSLELYIFHGFLQPVFRVVLPCIGIHAPYASIMMNFICCTALSLIFAWMCRKLRLSSVFFRPVSFFLERRKEKES